MTIKQTVLGLSLTFMAPAAELRIDHATVCGPSLAAMESQYASLGLRFDYGGPHSNHATEMALASFPDGSYLELIAFQPKAGPQAAAAHYWSKLMRDNAGPCAWAVGAPDIKAEAERLRATGLDIAPVERSGRLRPDGVRLDWETAGTAGHGRFYPFLIRDLTPREHRVYPRGKANNPEFRGIVQVVIAVVDLDSAIARYRKAYDWPAPKREKDHASFTGTPVVLAVQADRVKQFGEGVSEFAVETAAHKVVRINAKR